MIDRTIRPPVQYGSPGDRGARSARWSPWARFASFATVAPLRLVAAWMADELAPAASMEAMLSTPSTTIPPSITNCPASTIQG
jgi:hypothetical protein